MLLDIIKQIGDQFLHPISLANINDPNHPLIYINRPFKELTLYSDEELFGKNCKLLQGPETDSFAVKRISEAINSRSPICQDLINYTKDGKLFYNRLLLIPFREDSKIYCIGLQHLIDKNLYKPIYYLDRLFLEEKALNPLTNLVGIMTFQTPNLQKDISDTLVRIRNFVLSL